MSEHLQILRHKDILGQRGTLSVGRIVVRLEGDVYVANVVTGLETEAPDIVVEEVRDIGVAVEAEPSYLVLYDRHLTIRLLPDIRSFVSVGVVLEDVVEVRGDTTLAGHVLVHRSTVGVVVVLAQ
jgi:hypothetical protein